MARKNAIVVLGMHRSGTSMLAGILAKMGVDFGGDLLPPMEGVNEKGFWEHRRLIELNESLLSNLNSSWCHPGGFDDGWQESEAARRYINEATDFVEEVFDSEPVFGMKDPRLCLILPLWKEIFNRLGVDAHYLAMSRNPIDVAMSLYRRDKIPPILGLWLNDKYQDAVEQAGVKLTMRLDYNEMLQDIGLAVQSLSEQLYLPLDEAIKTRIADFASTSMCHSSYAFDAKYFQYASQANADQNMFMLMMHVFEEWWNEHGEKLRIVQHLDVLEKRSRLLGRQYAHAQQVVAQRDVQLAEVSEQLEHLGREYAHAQQVVAQRDVQLAEVSEQLKHLGREHAHAQQVVAQRDVQLAEVSEQLKHLGREHAHAQQVVGERDKQLAELQDVLNASFYGRLILRRRKGVK